MLKIRISGSESELKQVAHKAGNTHIQRFKHKKGKMTFAIDVQSSVDDFLENLDLSDDNSSKEEKKEEKKNCNPRELQDELQSLLDELS